MADRTAEQQKNLDAFEADIQYVEKKIKMGNGYCSRAFKRARRQLSLMKQAKQKYVELLDG